MNKIFDIRVTKIFFFVVCLLLIRTANSQIIIVSNSNWKVDTILHPGWNTIGFNDAAWTNSTSPVPLSGVTPIVAGSQGMWWVNTSVTDAYFRKIFDIEKRITNAIAEISIDNEFNLYVNGVFVVTGSNLNSIDTFNIVPYLQCGANVIAIHGIEWVPGTPSLISFKATIDTSNAPISINAAICQGSTYQLPDGNIVSKAGVYCDTLKTSQGCDSVIITTLTVKPIFIQNISVSICAGGIYILPSGKTTTKAGIYNDIIQSSQGCDSVIITDLTLKSIPVQNISASICEGANYQLSSGKTTTDAGIYYDTIQNFQGCDSIIITTLTFFPQPVDAIIIQHVFCYGSYDGGIKLSASGGTAPYTFQLLGFGTNSNGRFNNLSAGNYSYLITDKNGCSVLGNCIINQPNKIIISATPESEIIGLGDSVIYDISCNYPNANFQWNPTTYLSCDTCKTPTSTPEVNIIYTITATILLNGHTCSADTTVRIYINQQFFIPNAFTPNGDGFNDLFQIIGENLDKLRNFSFKIYNRWGNIIFETTNPLKAWDGKYKQKDVPMGVYVYEITYYDLNSNQMEVKRGSITLIR